jgi:CDP-paratose 2-epimerase
MMEAIRLCEEITGKKMNYSYSQDNRIGDHIWWISDMSRFRRDFPQWTWKYNIKDILVQIYSTMSQRAL